MATAPYRLIVSNAARKDLLALPCDVQERIRPEIAALAGEPRPHGSGRLTGSVDIDRIRVGIYRVVSHVDDDESTVTVTRVKHRRDVYGP